MRVIPAPIQGFSAMDTLPFSVCSDAFLLDFLAAVLQGTFFCLQPGCLSLMFLIFDEHRPTVRRCPPLALILGIRPYLPKFIV